MYKTKTPKSNNNKTRHKNNKTTTNNKSLCQNHSLTQYLKLELHYYAQSMTIENTVDKKISEYAFQSETVLYLFS